MQRLIPTRSANSPSLSDDRSKSKPEKAGRVLPVAPSDTKRAIPSTIPWLKRAAAHRWRFWCYQYRNICHCRIAGCHSKENGWRGATATDGSSASTAANDGAVVNCQQGWGQKEEQVAVCERNSNRIGSIWKAEVSQGHRMSPCLLCW